MLLLRARQCSHNRLLGWPASTCVSYVAHAGFLLMKPERKDAEADPFPQILAPCLVALLFAGCKVYCVCCNAEQWTLRRRKRNHVQMCTRPVIVRHYAARYSAPQHNVFRCSTRLRLLSSAQQSRNSCDIRKARCAAWCVSSQGAAPPLPGSQGLFPIFHNKVLWMCVRSCIRGAKS